MPFCASDRQRESFRCRCVSRLLFGQSGLMQASTLRAFRAGHNGGTIKRGIGSRAARVIAKGLSLDKDPRHFGKLGLQLQFELRDSGLDPTRRYGVVKIETECDEQITRTEMHRQDLVDA